MAAAVLCLIMAALKEQPYAVIPISTRCCHVCSLLNAQSCSMTSADSPHPTGQ
jgi:hypothetical protein